MSAATLKNVEMDNTMITTHVNASVEIHQLASTHTITTQTLVNVIVDLMTAMLVNTLTPRAAAVSVQSTRPAQTINTSMIQLAIASVTM